MKALLVLALSTSAFAGVTKKEAIRLAAKEIVAQGWGQGVGGCEHLRTGHGLLRCVVESTNMSYGFLVLPENAVLTEEVELTYYNDSNDCALNVVVQPDGAATIDAHWDCN